MQHQSLSSRTANQPLIPLSHTLPLPVVGTGGGGGGEESIAPSPRSNTNCWMVGACRTLKVADCICLASGPAMHMHIVNVIPSACHAVHILGCDPGTQGGGGMFPAQCPCSDFSAHLRMCGHWWLCHAWAPAGSGGKPYGERCPADDEGNSPYAPASLPAATPHFPLTFCQFPFKAGTAHTRTGARARNKTRTHAHNPCQLPTSLD